MKVVFLPALVDSSMDWIYEIQGEDVQWEWPHALISYHYWRNLRCNFPEDLYIFGDSGGFSVVTQGAVIDPLEVMRWQLRHCHAGVILDRPPYSASGGQQFAGSASDLFHSALATTCSNVAKALPEYLHDGGDFVWYGVLQGDSPQQIQEWYDAVRRVYEFGTEWGEGWAIAPKPSTDIISIARYLGFVRKEQLRRIHVLQVTSSRPVAAMVVLAQMAEVEFLTFDSATATLYATNHKYLIPHPREPDWNFSCIQQQTRQGDTCIFDLVTAGACDCLGCRLLEQALPTLNVNRLPQYLLLHNYLFIDKLFQHIVEWSAKTPEMTLRWATGMKYGAVMREFESQSLVAGRVGSTVNIFSRLK